MITEDYVSFETAKLLKEKEFCLSIKTAYNQQGILNLCEELTNGVKSLCNADFDRYYNSNFISAPTLQMTMKWLREVHNLNIGILFGHLRDFKTHWNFYIEGIELGRKSMFFHTYEEACEAAILYCLENLIKK